jgi:phosphate transport system substrate-binding protein
MTKRLTILITAVAAVLVAALAASAKSNDTTITGAGSTFVQPLVNAWTPALGKAFGYTVQYSGVGSGAGIAAITAKQVDFGASDAPLNAAQHSACADCIQIPWALSATAVAYNVPGAPVHLNLDGNTISKIFLGQITSWNDPAIRALNRGANLPDLKITPVFRSDGSGTSYNFTDYLSHVSHSWKSKVGTGTFVNWPVGVGYQHSSGVAGAVKGTPGAIGYVDVDYAVVNKLGYFKLKNRAGNYVVPKLKGIKAAAELDTHPAKNGSLSIVNPPKSRKYKNAYPISTYTYVDVQEHSANASALKKLIGWAVTKGDAKYGPKLFFAPLPRAVVKFDKKQLKKIHS